jgi:hypothetical protein
MTRTSALGSSYASLNATPVRMSRRCRTVAPSYPEPAISGTYWVIGALGSRWHREARIPQTHPTMDFETDIKR